ncbi:MAG: ATP-dependent DNA helicase RecG [Bacteroidaceae bacterium]|nr:ATP-dependent DNA helicase RecG [Bacteroidaceae bacterium]
MIAKNVLDNPVTYLSNVGETRARLLRDGMGISTYADLLMQFPSKHIDRSRFYYTHELTSDMPYVQMRGQILSFEEEGFGRKRRIIGHFSDGHGIVDLVWFNGLQYVERSYKLLTEYVIFGKPTLFRDRFNITHPEIESAERFSRSGLGLRPYYSIPEKLQKRGINTRMMEQWVSTVFRVLHEPLPETLPEYLVRELRLMPRDEAIRAMHYPQSAEHLSRASFRLKFEELFFIQLNILRYSRERNRRYAGYKFTRVGELFNDFYYHHLPFPLTEAQKRVIREIHADMKSGRQMNRLLQGDVGSGKTLVALMSMLIALDNNYQACIMAPTEILAEQHLETFRQFLGDMPIRVELLTGMVKGKRRQAIFDGLLSGEVHILIGTHAVIEDNVQFRNLGLVVIDEQHRFGVAQRAKLWNKGQGVVPHVLVMTATPIPRTLAMTVYGDLDVSVIDELPPGRKPIQTIHHYENRLEDLYRGLRQQIDLGRQAYIVYPLIKESEKIDLKNLEEGYQQFCRAFPDLRISKVHGKMKSAEKDAEMERFVRGETQILMATTVIEVGVNVPNASVMVIENAERFGLAQLHQLRGRVGRGAEQSYCILVTGFKLASDTRRRIQIMCETNDGFEIAEEDMRLRGPGDLEGTQQSGIPFDLHIANLARDGQVVQLARDVAKRVLESDPQCDRPDHAMMWQTLRDLNKSNVDWSAIS